MRRAAGEARDERGRWGAPFADGAEYERDVTTATASAALKNQLVDLSPLATGLEISQFASSTRPLAVLIHEADRRQQAISKLAARLHLERPVFTVELSLPVTLATASGD